MSSIPESIEFELLSDRAAANADRLDEAASPPVNVVNAPSGWDPYEVWRRLIKEPRDQRWAQKNKN